MLLRWSSFRKVLPCLQRTCEGLLDWLLGSRSPPWQRSFSPIRFQTSSISQSLRRLCSWELSKLLKWFHTLALICASQLCRGLQRVPWTSCLVFCPERQCQMWDLTYTVQLQTYPTDAPDHKIEWHSQGSECAMLNLRSYSHTFRVCPPVRIPLWFVVLP